MLENNDKIMRIEKILDIKENSRKRKFPRPCPIGEFLEKLIVYELTKPATAVNQTVDSGTDGSRTPSSCSSDTNRLGLFRVITKFIFWNKILKLSKKNRKHF